MVTVVLQNANIEVINTKRGKFLLSSDMNEAKKRINRNQYRPDILHQCLLILLDSPLNKSGQLEILIELTTKKIIKLNKSIRIPRVYNRFNGLFVQLLERHRIYSEESRIELMKVEKEGIEYFISNDSIKIGLSQEGENFYEIIKKNNTEYNTYSTVNNDNSTINNRHSVISNNNNTMCNKLYNDNNTEYNTHSVISNTKIPPYVFYINAISSGDDPNKGMDYILSLSSYGLSAATCCSKICTYFEEVLNIF
ncbi:rRNA small subunit pseudouridine methyltransferase Nep1 [Nematocida sp. ERTm5]|nr:rRNA small subunit pseudouridine methyltransferase Nep1 [Nematocida sp. ERTm5]